LGGPIEQERSLVASTDRQNLAVQLLAGLGWRNASLGFQLFQKSPSTFEALVSIANLSTQAENASAASKSFWAAAALTALGRAVPVAGTTSINGN